MGWELAAGAIGSALLGGLFGSKSASDAASAQEEAAKTAAQAQLQMYGQSREDLAPWRTAGGYAVNNLTRMIAAGPGGTLAPSSGVSQNTLAPQGVPTAGPAPATPGAAPVSPLPPNAIVGPAYAGNGTFIPSGYWGMPVDMGEGNIGVREIQRIPEGGTITAQGTPVGITAPNALVGQGQAAQGTAAGLPELPSNYGSDWQERYQKSPYYNFLVDEGTKALERGAAAKGKQFSGQQAKALQQFGQNTALTDYDNWLKNWYQSLTPWQSLAGLGQTSAGQTASAAMQTGNNLANNAYAQGNAQAAGTLGVAAPWVQNLNALAGNLGNAYVMQQYGNGGQNFVNPTAQQADANYLRYIGGGSF